MSAPAAKGGSGGKDPCVEWDAFPKIAANRLDQKKFRPKTTRRKDIKNMMRLMMIKFDSPAGRGVLELLSKPDGSGFGRVLLFHLAEAAGRTLGNPPGPWCYNPKRTTHVELVEEFGLPPSGHWAGKYPPQLGMHAICLYEALLRIGGPAPPSCPVDATNVATYKARGASVPAGVARPMKGKEEKEMKLALRKLSNFNTVSPVDEVPIEFDYMFLKFPYPCVRAKFDEYLAATEDRRAVLLAEVKARPTWRSVAARRRRREASSDAPPPKKKAKTEASATP
jgi:hypothetical protein